MLNIKSLFDPAIPLIGVYPNELKMGAQTNITTQMFIMAFFTVAKRWNNPSGHQWMNG